MPGFEEFLLISDKTTEQELIRVIDRSPYPRLYRKCLDANAFTRIVNNPFPESFPFDISETQLRPLIEPDLAWFEAAQSSLEETIAKIQVLDSFDFPAEGKVATQTAISILHRLGIVDLLTLRGASRYIGPTNTVFINEKLSCNFRTTEEYDRFRDSLLGEGVSHEFNDPYPRGKRSKYFKLEMGGKWLRHTASQYLDVAQSLGINLTTEQALRMAAVNGAAHEYGHAINRALNQQGISTFERSKSRGFLRAREKLGFNAEKVHDEHFAGTIKNLILHNFLQTELNLSQEQVNRFFQVYNKDNLYAIEAAYAFLEYATRKGYTPNEIIGLQNAVILRADQMYGNRIYIMHLNEAIYYKAQPYSEEQLKILLKRNNG